MNVVAESFHVRKVLVWLNVAGGISLALPAIVHIHVLIAGRFQPRADHGVGLLANESITYIAPVVVPTVPAHWRSRSKTSLLCRERWDEYGARKRRHVQNHVAFRHC